jgi:hypothetical protein
VQPSKVPCPLISEKPGPLVLSRDVDAGMRLALAAASIGSAPFIGGYLLSRRGWLSTAGSLPPCPFRALTGHPCPSCGGRRAFAAVASGDRRWREYNAPLVYYSAALVIAAITLSVVPKQERNSIAAKVRRHRAALRTRPLATLVACLLVALPPWIAALRFERKARGRPH